MSQTSPSASGQPRNTPFAASRASSEPLATCSCSPVSRSTWSQNAGPSARLAHRRGRHRDHARQLHAAGERGEAVQRRAAPAPSPPG